MQPCFWALTLLRCIVPGRLLRTPTSARSARGALAGVVQQSSRRLAVGKLHHFRGVCVRQGEAAEAELQGARTDHTVLLTAISTSVLADVHVSGYLCAREAAEAGSRTAGRHSDSPKQKSIVIYKQNPSDLYATVCSGSGRSCRSGRRSCRAPRRTERRRNRNGRLRSGSSSRCRARRGASPRT